MWNEYMAECETIIVDVYKVREIYKLLTFVYNV